MEGMKNKTVGRRLLLYTMVIMAILLPLGISAVHLATNQDVEIEIENKHVETLIVRIAYSPELATYIGVGAAAKLGRDL
ncbi:MAG: hypothetical protein ACUVQY_03230 [Thermoproteota archaeon]